MTTPGQPPFYILCEHSTTHPSPPSNTLAHPTIQYHYADDSPLALWPQHPNEHVLVIDYDPTSATQPTVQSMSKDLAILSLKIEEAPGAAAADGNDLKNDKMYLIQTTATDPYVVLSYICMLVQQPNLQRCRPCPCRPQVCSQHLGTIQAQVRYHSLTLVPVETELIPETRYCVVPFCTLTYPNNPRLRRDSITVSKEIISTVEPNAHILSPVQYPTYHF